MPELEKLDPPSFVTSTTATDCGPRAAGGAVHCTVEADTQVPGTSTTDGNIVPLPPIALEELRNSIPTPPRDVDAPLAVETKENRHASDGDGSNPDPRTEIV